jgi:hypothetical protein
MAELINRTNYGTTTTPEKDTERHLSSPLHIAMPMRGPTHTKIKAMQQKLLYQVDSNLHKVLTTIDSKHFANCEKNTQKNTMTGRLQNHHHHS